MGDKSGYYISTAGDYNNDTYRDLLVSATYAFNKVGAVYIITNSLGSNTRSPTLAPNNLPKPSKRPSVVPTAKPSRLPSVRPSKMPSGQPTRIGTLDNAPTCDPSTSSSSTDTSQPSDDSIDITAYPTRKLSRVPSSTSSEYPLSYSNIPSRRPTHSPSLPPSNYPTNIITSLSPVQSLVSSSPSLDPTSSPSLSSDINSSSIFNKLENNKINANITVDILLVSLLALTLTSILILVYFREMYKFVMDKAGYDFRKPAKFDSTLRLRVATLQECIEYFWKYEGLIYKLGTVTDDLFIRFSHSVSSSHESSVLNALDHICINPNLLCPMSYYKVVCHMANRKSEAIRNKAYETLLICKPVMDKCVTVECIQLLKRMLIDSGRSEVKNHAIAILSEICHVNPTLITFDIYGMLRSYKCDSDTTLAHAIEILLQEIRQHCVHLHSQIEEFDKSFLVHGNKDGDIESSQHSFDALNTNQILNLNARSIFSVTFPLPENLYFASAVVEEKNRSDGYGDISTSQSCNVIHYEQNNSSMFLPTIEHFSKVLGINDSDSSNNSILSHSDASDISDMDLNENMFSESHSNYNDNKDDIGSEFSSDMEDTLESMLNDMISNQLQI
jgi:hypothetical protein